MTWGIALRWQVAGRIPATNMYESMLFLAWGVGLFAVVAFAVMRNRLVVLNANVMAALTMVLTDQLPMDRFIHPAAPVLSGRRGSRSTCRSSWSATRCWRWAS